MKHARPRRPARRYARVAWTEVPAVVLLSLAAASVGLLLVGVHTPLLAAAVGAVVAAGLLRLPGPASVPRPRAADRRAVGAVVALAVLFVVGGHVWPGERLFTDRDPATYTVTARWLVDHDDLVMDARPELYGEPEGADLGWHSLGFQPDDLRDPVSVPQGTHAVPALAALPGALAGDRALLAAGAWMGATALLALFGLARRFVPDVAAAVVTAAAAVSLPVIAFSWTLHTEPLSLALALAAAGVLVDAARAPAPGRSALLAGALAGGVSLARPDGPLVVVGLAVAAGAVAVMTGRRRVLLALLAAVPVALLGAADVVTRSGPYAANLEGELALMAGLVAVTAAAAAVVGSVVRVRRVPPAVGWGAAGLVVALSAALVSRPLWLVSRRSEPSEGMAALQRAAGLAVDPYRDYGELTLSWFAWYWGWPALVGGVLGLAALVEVGLRRDPRSLVPLLLLGPGAVVLVAPAVSPDQVWAARRLLVAVVPLLLLGVAGTLVVLRRVPRIGSLLAAALAVAVVAVPAVVTRPLLAEPNGAGELAAVRATCAQTAPGHAVVLTDGASISGWAQTLRAFCRRPVLGVQNPTPEVLAGVAATLRGNGLEPLVVTFRPWSARLAAPPTLDVPVQRWEAPLLRAPREVVVDRRVVWVGDVAPDGTVVVRPPVTS